MNKINFLFACLALACAVGHADSIPTVKVSHNRIPVDSARFWGPSIVRMPYEVDSTDMKGKGFDAQSLLKDNAVLVDKKVGAGWATIASGQALTNNGLKGTDRALTLLNFGVTAPRFMKASLEVKKLKDYKIYVDGVEKADGKLELLPGCTDITLLCLSSETSRDSFSVAITGDSLDGLTAGINTPHPYSMRDMMMGDHYRNVSVSPSGRYAVIVYYFTKPDGKNLFRTVLTDLKTGKDVRRWNEYRSFRWLDNRDAFYYDQNNGTGRQLVLFDATTGYERVLSENLPSGGYTLSPNLKYVVLSRLAQGRDVKGGLKRLENPDDRQSGWRSRNYLLKYDLESGVVQPLTFGSASVWLQDISHDGAKLLLSFGRMEPSRRPFDHTAYVEMDSNTGLVDTLLVDTAFIASAQYSPNADKVLFKASPAAFGGIGEETAPGQTPSMFDYRLYIYDKTSRKTQPLLRNFAPSVDDVVWSGGDGQIYFLATDGCDRSLFRVSPEGGKALKYELPLTYVSDWGISVSTKVPRLAFFGQTATRAREMFVCQLDRTKPRTERIGEIDFDELAKGISIGECKDWNFTNSRGDTIKGFYYLPPNFDATKKYPVIVYYYGGCTPTSKVLEFQYPFQVFAAQGYVVYVVEPSGTIGYGQEFAARHVGAWGKMTADDIIEGTKQFLSSHSFADTKKVGCLGASYGGFMTQYLLTQTDIFATGISHAGISNIASYWGGGYWGYTYGEVAQYGSYPWNARDLYVEQSPLFNADKIHTPLLLLHGTADTNVPTNESQQLFTALRILGRPVSYVQIEGENHVITDFNKRLKWQNTIFAWFANWLKNEPLWWTTLYPGDNFGLK